MTGPGRHVLLFTVSFPPDNVSTAHLVADLAVDLTAAGHRVSVVTTRAHSNPDPGGRVDFPGMRVTRLWVPRKGRSAVFNAFIWLLFLVGAFTTGMLRRDRPDVVLAVTPPPGIGLVGRWVARRHHARLVYNVKELYPDVAQALGILDLAPLVWAMRQVEDRAFRRADAIVAVTEAVAGTIRPRAGSSAVVVIPDGVDVDAIAPGADPSRFRAEFAITAPLVIGYAGNMGAPQHLDLLVEAAALLVDLPIQVVLVGEGTERDRLARRAAGIPNVVMVPQQPFARVPEIYAACDVMYVPLAPGLGPQVMPSKAYQALAAGRPILAAAPADSMVTTLAVESGAGFPVADLTRDGVAAVIRSIDPADLPAMGARGRAHMVANYSRRAVTDAYRRLIESD